MHDNMDSGGRREQRDFSPIVGKYNKILFGQRADMRGGYIDAPHATALDGASIDRVLRGKVNTGSFLTDDGLVMPSASRIYLDARMRDLFEVAPGSTLLMQDASGRERALTVANARHGAEGGKFVPITMRAEMLSGLKRLIQQKYQADARTGEIAQKFNELGGTSMITTVSRGVCDINRYPDFKGTMDADAQKGGVEEYRRFKEEILRRVGNLGASGEAVRPFLHIALHGKKDFDSARANDSDIELGTARGASCADKNVVEWLEEALRRKLAEKNVILRNAAPVVNTDVRLWGDPSKSEGSRQHGDNFMTVQMEVCRNIRNKYDSELAQIFAELIQEFTNKFHK